MAEREELRAYFFQNMYLQGIHAGIQTAHTVAEMSMKYNSESPGYKLGSISYSQIEYYSNWAMDYKTIVTLNGGMQGNLREVVDLFSDEDNPYPWAAFCESGYALNGALTNVGIILPENIYTWNAINKNYEQTGWRIPPKLTEWEAKLVNLLGSKRLMN